MGRLDEEERKAVYRKISQYESNLTDPNASIELKNVSAERIQHYESILKGESIGKPLFYRDIKTGKKEIFEGTTE